MGTFRMDRPELGPRLDQMRRVGLPRLMRLGEEEERAAEAAGAAHSCGGKPTPTRELERSDRPVRPPRGGIVAQEAGPKKRGPAPSSDRPWEGLGISRRTWFRRKKEGGG